MSEEKQRAMTNSVYVEGETRFVETRKAGDHSVTSFSLDNIDKRGFHNYMPVEMWNASQEVLDLLESDEPVLVQGSIKLNKWTSKDGEEKKKILINAFEIKDAASHREARASSGFPGKAKTKSVKSTPRVVEPEQTDIGGENPFLGL